MIAEPKEPKIYIAMGPNWTCEIPINEFNEQFDEFDQVCEAATTAVEVFKNLREKPELVPAADCNGEKLGLGLVVRVWAKDGPSSKLASIPTYICLANAGFYEESMKWQKLLEIELTAQEAQNAPVKKTKKAKNPKNK